MNRRRGNGKRQMCACHELVWLLSLSDAMGVQQLQNRQKGLAINEHKEMRTEMGTRKVQGVGG